MGRRIAVLVAVLASAAALTVLVAGSAFAQTPFGGYGPGGMMGGFGPWSGQAQQPAADMPVKADQAIADANAYLAQAFPGAQAATDPSTFYGYYTMDFSKDGKTVGMLSVNGYTGHVWYHTWHGTFISEKQIGS